MRLSLSRLALSAALTLAASGAASDAAAQAIYAPVGGTVTAGGPGFGALASTFDQSGLSVGYTSGVTDFAAYLASGPTHTFTTAGMEWFSAPGTSASVTYDLGQVRRLTRLALWNEESAGIGSLSVFGSTDGITFAPLAAGLAPTDHPGGDYPADVFTLAAQDARYVRFDMSGCPQPDPAFFQGCAIGEVAFEAFPPGATTTTPEPGTLALLAGGLLGVVGAVRTRQKRAPR